MPRSSGPDVHFLLQQWSAWCYTDRGLSINFPSIEPHERMRRNGAPAPQITDSTAIYLDRVVSGLRLTDPDEFEALTLHYIGRKAYRQIAKQMGTNHKAVADWVYGAKKYLKGALESYHAANCSVGVDVG